MKRMYGIAALAAVLTVVLTGAAFAVPEFVIKVGYILPETQSDHIIMRDVFKKDIEEKSGGRISVELYPNGQLGGDRELIESVQLGTVQVAIPATSALAGFDKRFQVFDLPFLFKSKETAFKALDGELGHKVDELLKPLGMRNLGYGENGYRHITNNRNPVRKPDDLKGIKLRTMENPLHLAFFKMLGANPTPMSFGELYTALQQGTVDGQENPVVLVYTAKFFEVQKFYSLTGHVYSATMLVANDDFFASMPEDLWKIVEDAGKRYVVEQRVLAEEQEHKFLDELKKVGLQINELTPEEKQLFIDATLPVYDQFKDIIGAELVELAKKANLD